MTLIGGYLLLMKIAERHQIMKYLVRTGKKKLSETPELTKEVKSDTKVIAKKENPNYYKQKMEALNRVIQSSLKTDFPPKE